MEEGKSLITDGIVEADWAKARRATRPLAPEIAAVLESQNVRYAASPARTAHLAALRSGAAAVVTGQQTGLFLGPLYTLYKAASAIRLARWLAEQWSTPVVPVFWLQTEDHDAAEIAVCNVARGSGDPLTLTLEVEDDGVSIAHRVLPAEISDTLRTLGEEISRLPHGEEHLGSLTRHYRPGVGWGVAFAGLLAELFAEEGLVLIDPRDPALAPLASSVHRRALTDAVAIARALTERVETLESSGRRAGVHVRENAPLSFFHPDGPEGRRCRLVATETGFVEAGTERAHSLDELLSLLDATPSAFSTSALLRPILQDTWLPTAAYVGGPAEVAYFEQLPPLYAAFALPMPIVVHRAHLRLVDEPSYRALSRHGLTPAAACRPFEEVLASARAAVPGELDGVEIARRVVDGVDRVLTEIAPLVREAGERAEESLEKTRGSLSRLAEKLGRGYDKARLLRDRELVDDVRRVQAKLYPQDMPQERFFGLSSFAARLGQRVFVERVLAAAEPTATGFTDLAI
jgi:bacillithiol biosynthesis cysteine-adding enzyme BshC